MDTGGCRQLPAGTGTIYPSQPLAGRYHQRPEPVCCDYLSDDRDGEWLHKEFVLGMPAKNRTARIKKYRQVPGKAGCGAVSFIFGEDERAFFAGRQQIR